MALSSSSFIFPFILWSHPLLLFQLTKQLFLKSEKKKGFWTFGAIHHFRIRKVVGEYVATWAIYSFICQLHAQLCQLFIKITRFTGCRRHGKWLSYIAFLYINCICSDLIESYKSWLLYLNYLCINFLVLYIMSLIYICR